MNAFQLDTRIDEICDQFEADLRAGTPVSIESTLANVEHADRENLLYWLLGVELAYRRETDESVSIQSYLERFPESHETITTYFREVPSDGDQHPKIPGYQIVDLISRGGQGAVYKAVQLRTGQDVALKFISLSVFSGLDEKAAQQAYANFEAELKIAATLRHPNAVRLYDAGQTPEGAYLIMELVRGGNLAERGRRLNQFEAADMIRLIAEAVSEAHRGNILHLDIKPQNILIDDEQGQPRLVDFGLARLESIGKRSESIAGTPGYMAPEQLSRDNLDVRTDVFGLGATLYVLLTGKKPIQGAKLEEMLARPGELEVVSPRSIRPEVDERLEQICMKCLESSVDKRFQTVAELIESLESIRNREGARNTAHMANGVLVVAITFFVINILVAVMLASSIHEAFIWPTIFLVYLPLFTVFHIYPPGADDPSGTTHEQMWSIWIGKCVTEICACIALRILVDDLYLAIGIAYTFFMAMSGMAVCCSGARFWAGFYVMAVAFWLLVPVLALAAIWGSVVGPVIYAFSSIGIVAYVVHLRKIAIRLQSQAAKEQYAPTLRG